MNILVINSGSSSIKYQLITMPNAKKRCSGQVERIGLNDSLLHFESDDFKLKKTISAKNHSEALNAIANVLINSKHAVIKSANDIDSVGHRVVHGGSTFTKTVIIDANVKAKIKSLFALAPLHNPPNLEGILVAENTFKNAKQVAVFDTAFHQSIPEEAHTYAIPKLYITKHQIRQFGFHGISHKYVSEKANQYLGLKASKLITIHLGNGCSITAVQNGKSVDHSMGFGPMNGLVMGTRSGDIDPSIIFYLQEQLGMSFKAVNSLLQKQSGMLGLTGYSDLRDIEENAIKGDNNCKLALLINAYRIKKFIGSYAAVMNGLDAIIFTAGIGENSSLMRQLVCDKMNYLGIKLDDNKNTAKIKSIKEIQSKNATTKILVVPTNEELEIANQSYALLNPKTT